MDGGSKNYLHGFGWVLSLLACISSGHNDSGHDEGVIYVALVVERSSQLCNCTIGLVRIYQKLQA